VSAWTSCCGAKIRRSLSLARWPRPTCLSIVVDEERHAMDVVVDDEEPRYCDWPWWDRMSALASELTGWKINIMDAAESAQKLAVETDSGASSSLEKLDVDEEIADILIAEGFTSLEEVAYVPLQECWKLKASTRIRSMNYVPGEGRTVNDGNRPRRKRGGGVPGLARSGRSDA